MADTPSKPSLLTRLRRAVTYTIAGVDGAWMSPQQPIMPQAQQQTHGRQWDYPIAFNINYIPRTSEALSFDKLRYLAENCGVLREVIETRKDQVEAMAWAIVPRKDESGHRPKNERYKSQIEKITTFLQQPDGNLDWGQWIREVLEQHFVFDAVSIYRQPTRGGGLYALRVIDGSKISVMIDADGRSPEPPSVAYQQVLKGIVANNYSRDELVYFPKNPRADRVYGYPPVAQIVWYVEMAIARVREQVAFYTQGNVPTGIMEAPVSMSTDQIERMQAYWDSMFSGNIEQRAHLWWVPGGSKYSELKRDKLFDEFDEWLARVVCYTFSISPQPFVKMMNRGTAATAQETATEEGMQPTLFYIKRLMDRFIREDFQQPDLEFKWQADEEVDPAKSAAIDWGDAANAVRTIDEIRQARGLDAFGGAASLPMVKTPQGYVPLDPQEAQELRTPPALAAAAAAGAQPPGGKPGQKGKPGQQTTGKKPPPGEKTGPQASGKGPAPSGKGPVKKFASLYVSRPLLNSYDLARWAETNGLGKLLNYDVHVKVGDSRTEVDWELIPQYDAQAVVIVEGGARKLAAGPDGLVLYFDSLELTTRADDLEKAEVIFNLDRPQPQMVLQVSRVPDDLDAVKAYDGTLLFGAEEYNQADVFGNLLKVTPEEVAAAAAEADPAPSAAQIAAGNYRHGHVTVQGLDIAIETAEGGTRSGVGPDGKEWSVVMPAHYGYVKRTTGADEDQVDVYLGPNPDSDRVWVIDQLDLATGEFDEHKAFLGFDSAEDVLDAYIGAFNDGRGFDRIGGITRMDVEGFKDWLEDGDTTVPVSKDVSTHTGLAYHDLGIDPQVGAEPRRRQARVDLPEGSDMGAPAATDNRQSVTVPPFYTQKVYRNVADLPQAVKDKIKSPKRRRQWMQVWNSIYAQTKNEQRAFAGAWAATERAGGVKTASHGHAEDYARY